MIKNVLAIDLGFGDTKCAYGVNGKLSQLFKFTSVVAEVVVNESVQDKRVISFNDKHYYIGKDALNVESSSIIDIDTYSKLEYFSPLFVYRVLEELEIIPDVIVLGLSIAQINNSGYFKKNIEDFLRKSCIASEVKIVPQGLIAKLAVDMYGVNFPDITKDFSSDSSYIIADIGFNTLDVCHVINGKTSSNLVRGIPERGATLIVQDLIIDIKEKFNIELNLSEGKEVLSTNILKRRGVNYDVNDLINKSKSIYIDNLKLVIEDNFGKILDKIDNLILLGGGSYILATNDDDFVINPKQKAEYYNCLGMFIYGNN